MFGDCFAFHNDKAYFTLTGNYLPMSNDAISQLWTYK